MPSALTALAAAADGLLMPSESDAPFEPFTWNGPAPLTPEALLAHLGLPSTTPIETRTLTQLFAPLVREHAALDEPARARRDRFVALQKACEAHLADIAVYRVGTIEIQVFIVGATRDGGYAGLKTTVVET